MTTRGVFVLPSLETTVNVRPTAWPSAQNVRAACSLTIATSSAPATSPFENARPCRIGIATSRK
jgi:hypothetical protein